MDKKYILKQLSSGEYMIIRTDRLDVVGEVASTTGMIKIDFNGFISELVDDIDKYITKIANKFYNPNYSTYTNKDITLARECFYHGYKEALEDNKDKLYTRDDIINNISSARLLVPSEPVSVYKYKYSSLEVINNITNKYTAKEWQVELDMKGNEVNVVNNYVKINRIVHE